MHLKDCDGDAEKNKTRQAISLEKSVIRQIISLLNSGERSSERLIFLQNTIDNYFYTLCHKGNEYTLHFRTESFLRITRFLLNYPERFSIDVKETEYLYDTMRLIDKATYCLYQICTESVRPSVIKKFMEYVKDTEIEKNSIFFLYRISPSFVRDLYPDVDINELSKKELYYGITTGYFEYGVNAKLAIKRLKNMFAFDILNKLEKDGFAYLNM